MLVRLMEGFEKGCHVMWKFEELERLKVKRLE
jgi:hypothetical protein